MLQVQLFQLNISPGVPLHQIPALKLSHLERLARLNSILAAMNLQEHCSSISDSRVNFHFLIYKRMTYTETIEYLFSRLPMFSRMGAAAIKSDLVNTLKI